MCYLRVVCYAVYTLCEFLCYDYLIDVCYLSAVCYV